MALAQHVHAEHAELADAMLSTLWGMFEGWGLAEQDAHPAAEPQSAGTGMQTAGNTSSYQSAFTLDHTVSHLIIC